MGMHATNLKIEIHQSTVYLLNILVNHYTRWTLVWWIEVGLRCNRTPSYCARSYTEVLPAGCWNDASRATAYVPHLIIGGYTENESTSRCDTAFSILVGKERRSPSEPSFILRQWTRKSANVEEKQPSSPFLGPKQCRPNAKDLGLLA
jgi:hypothetical protein